MIITIMGNVSKTYIHLLFNRVRNQWLIGFLIPDTIAVYRLSSLEFLFSSIGIEESKDTPVPFTK
jgi:hypothetical protein